MKIYDRHLFHGAALIQIAEHNEFTAINSYELNRKRVENIFRINDKTIIYLKHAQSPHGKFKEYIFTFTIGQLKDLDKIYQKEGRRIFIILVCVDSREICCITYGQLTQLIDKRKTDSGIDEKQYTILVTAFKKLSFKVYNSPFRKKETKLKEFTVLRKKFPGYIFKLNALLSN